MLFRDFQIIAAACYSAERAAAHASAIPLWDELDADTQNVHVQRVMALARGEQDPDRVFAGTAAAILGYNGGQGLLALEELSNIGGAVLALGLAEEADVADKNMRAVVVQMLEELAERREGGAAGPVYSDADLRRQALLLSAQRVPGEVVSESIVDAARVFYDFIVESDCEPWNRISALQQAAQVVKAGARASTIVLVAKDFMTFLEPPLELTETQALPSFDNSSDEPPPIKSGATVN
jgi:hypothetical protein